MAVNVVEGHQFNLVNRCGSTITPLSPTPTVDTRLAAALLDLVAWYAPSRYPNPAISYTGPQPGSINAGGSKSVTINSQWNGRIFAQNGHCGAKGEGCTMTEFNLDTGNQFTHRRTISPTSRHVFCALDYLRGTSNADTIIHQGFTQSIQIAVGGCDTVTCTNVGCGCKNAYPPGDLSGCGNDSPVRGCSAGSKTWTITFCP
ncbi:hypothetical protein BD779DRAFT_1667975 [Infundibulicybe gibba]|nr:hypothetical protein BD779DRAFT_1667975 [Infundibulicybe gibba]